MGLDKDRLVRVRNRATLAVVWLIPATLGVMCLLAQLAAGPARGLLRYDRSAVAAGEWWRLLSGHLVHLGWPHLAMNLSALALIWLLVGNAVQVKWWPLYLVLTVVAIDAGFWLLDPQLQWYVGLSGLLHGMLLAGIVAAAGRQRPELLVLGMLVVVKLVYEQCIGALPGSAETAGGAVVVNAHLYGAIGGALAALPSRIRHTGKTSI